MKRTVQITILSLFCLMGYAQTGDIMIIERNDGSRQEMLVDDIRRVFFETALNTKFGKPADALDLGLSVKWASWDMGATKIGEKGGFYGWADPTGEKTSTNENEYPSANPPACISGTEYDIAHVQWGEKWRLPTVYEIDELVDACKWSFSSDRVTGKAPNGQQIVFLLSGYRSGSTFYHEGEEGCYFSGTCYEKDGTFWANYLKCNKDSNKVFANWGLRRRVGANIRPIQGDDVNVITSDAFSSTTGYNVVQGTVAAAIGLSSYTRGFFLSTTGTPSSTNYSVKWEDTEKNVDGYYFALLDSKLKPATKYSVRAYVYSGGKYYYGKTLSFTTAAAQSSFSFSSATHTISGNSVTLSATVTSTNVSGSYQAGFMVNTSSTVSDLSYVNKTSSTFSGSGKQDVSSSLSLEGGQTYYYVPYVYYNGQYYYGQVKSVAIPATSKLFEEPYLVWNASKTTVKGYMKQYTLHSETESILQYEGKYKERFVAYLFDENALLYSAEVAIPTSKTTLDEINSQLKKTYELVDDSDGRWNYVSSDRTTVVIVSQNTERGLYYIDYISAEYLLRLYGNFFEEPYLSWGAARSNVKMQVGGMGYTLYTESTKASDHYYLVYEGKNRETMNVYYFDNSQRLNQVQIVFSGSMVDELAEFVTSELGYTYQGTSSDGTEHYFLTPNRLSTAIIYVSESGSTVATHVTYISSTAMARKQTNGLALDDDMEQAPQLRSKLPTISAGEVYVTADSVLDVMPAILAKRLNELYKLRKADKQ